MNENKSLSIAQPLPSKIGMSQKIGLALVAIGMLIFILALVGVDLNAPVFLGVALLSITIGIVIYANAAYLSKPEGIKNDGNWFSSLTNRGSLGWILGIILTGFYVFLYWYPQYLGLGKDGVANTGLVAFFDPLSQFFKGEPASEWFVYGTFYTLFILAFGYKFILKYRHNKYQILRTISVMFFQLGFAYLLPEILMKLKYPYYNFANMWPLNYYFFDEWSIQGFLSNGSLGMFMLGSGIAMIFIISPILTFFYGKRWYCSWVCGCGGLAETAGDPFRQLSSNKMSAWKFERWSIHIVLVLSVVMTIGVIYSYLTNNAAASFMTRDQFAWGSVIFIVLITAAVLIFKGKELQKEVRFIIGSVVAVVAGIILINQFSDSNNIVFIESYKLREWYGFGIGAAFSGVIGVGFYPLLGNRVWCRFGCPMAAILGLQQRLFSKFRITTNGGQCISCGNCSTYCEMGIDVRSYAQKGENIVRASCVGCGICSAVCPRGVLNLEVKEQNGRFGKAELLGNDSFK